MTQEVSVAVPQNGSAPALAPNLGLQLPGADGIVKQLLDLIEERRLRLTDLNAERDRLLNEMRAYEQALKPLTGDTPRKQKSKPKPRTELVREMPSQMSDKRLEPIKHAILAYAAKHDEFRQIDIRSRLGGSSSSTMAQAFELLRQNTPERPAIIRLSRKQGNSKFFRLTDVGLAEMQARS